MKRSGLELHGLFITGHLTLEQVFMFKLVSAYYEPYATPEMPLLLSYYTLLYPLCSSPSWAEFLLYASHLCNCRVPTSSGKGKWARGGLLLGCMYSTSTVLRPV